MFEEKFRIVEADLCSTNARINDIQRSIEGFKKEFKDLNDAGVKQTEQYISVLHQEVETLAKQSSGGIRIYVQGLDLHGIKDLNNFMNYLRRLFQ